MVVKNIAFSFAFSSTLPSQMLSYRYPVDFNHQGRNRARCFQHGGRH
jgi:hypothetical protein